MAGIIANSLKDYVRGSKVTIGPLCAEVTFSKLLPHTRFWNGGHFRHTVGGSKSKFVFWGTDECFRELSCRVSFPCDCCNFSQKEFPEFASVSRN